MVLFVYGRNCFKKNCRCKMTKPKYAFVAYCDENNNYETAIKYADALIKELNNV